MTDKTSSMPDIDALVARAWNGDACADAEGNCLGCGRPVDRVAEQIDCPVCFAFLDWLWKGDRRDASFPATEPDPVSVKMREQFPLLWEMANEYDFAERLGGCSSELHAEVDRAMREIWDARHYVAEEHLR